MLLMTSAVAELMLPESHPCQEQPLPQVQGQPPQWEACPSQPPLPVQAQLALPQMRGQPPPPQVCPWQLPPRVRA